MSSSSHIILTHNLPTPHTPQHYQQYPPTPSSATPIDAYYQFCDATQYADSLALLQQPAFPFMNDQYYTQNPPIRIQHSTPTPQPTAFGYRQDSVFGGSVPSPQDWQMYQAQSNSMGGGFPAQQTQSFAQRRRSHQRTPSASTVGSNGPVSPYTQNLSYPLIANTEQSPASPAHCDSYAYADQSGFSKHLPTPSQTPTDNFFSAFGNMSGYMPSQAAHTPAAHLAMKGFAIDHHNTAEAPEMAHSSRQSESSFGRDSPATPRTGSGDDVDEKHSKRRSNEYRQNGPNIQLQRTESAAMQDELYNPENFSSVPTSAAQQSASSTNSYLSPHRNLVTERLQTANIARTSSPTSTMSRERSPFRQGSPLAPTDGYSHARQPIGTAAGVRQAQKEEADQAAYAQHHPQLQREPTKTISPKDAMLDYNDEQSSLFQDSIPAGYKQNFGGPTEQFSTNFVSQPSQAYGIGGLPTTSQQQMTSFRATSADGYAGLSNFNFATPPIVQGQGQGQIQSVPFQADVYRSATNSVANNTSMPESTPEFPAHLTSMDSSMSDNALPPSSDGASAPVASISRPADTRAASGTYTCTYHGCSQRFDTPTNLQKHKRDFHRSQKDGSSGTASTSPRSTESPAPSTSGMTSSAILARNSQAGPHKCTRINPSTNKPCNTIFSRPYDLTRHEDTIHNNRKQKVRCPMCREEKTFSRNDALTRHMRVVHPEVESFGKRGRRGD